MTDLFRLPHVGRASGHGTERKTDQDANRKMDRETNRETNQANNHALDGCPDKSADGEYGQGHTATPPTPPETLWEVSVCQEDVTNPAYRSHLLEFIRSGVEAKLRDDPAARDLTWRTPLGTIEARACGNQSEVRGPIRLAFAPTGGDRAMSGRATVSNRMALPARPGERDPDEPLPFLRLPDEPTRLLGERLVGLADARRTILQLWESRWDGALDAWARKTDCSLPHALLEHLQESHELLLLHGDPGTGKSALARTVADLYCRRHGIGGTALWLTTQARGHGLVGDFSQRLRSAFRQLRDLPEEELKLLVIDEADSIAMRRSEAQSHQEDKAATSSLIQSLDEAAGTRRLVVIMTSNTVGQIDAAIQRRAHLIAFERPGILARRALLARWLPQLSAQELEGAVAASDAMTAADIERTLAEAWMAAASADTRLMPAAALSALRQATRTSSV